VALLHSIHSHHTMTATIQMADPLVLSDPITLGVGSAATSISAQSRDSTDRPASSHSRKTSTANPLNHTATANGSLSSPPNRTSPIPNQAQPNGKLTSPHVERSNAMANGDATAPQTVSSKDPKAAAQAASDMKNIVRRKLTGYVGFANLPINGTVRVYARASTSTLWSLVSGNVKGVR
jgi:hypothetical protein